MRYLSSISALLLLPVIVGCSNHAPIPETRYATPQSLAIDASFNSPSQTVLLVSLEDGSVIKQMIDADAEICFKQISNSATTCLSEGAPIIDSATNTIIGFEMVENQIDLVARPN